MIPMSTCDDCWFAPTISRPGRWLGLLVAVWALAALPLGANVYPTSVKINDGYTNTLVAAGSGVNISYILNEPASAGVTIKVLAGVTAVRTISLSAGSAGTLRGTNTIVWNGNGDDSNPVAAGTYSIAITAASQGYPVWTQTTDDNAEGNNVWAGRGIGVDQNTNSPYYGRVLVANSEYNDAMGNNWLGYQVGILKCNADGSYAEEGGVSTGGYPWAGDTFSPWRLEISRDDFVYVNDFTTNGQVIRWDPTISTNSELPVLRPDNWTNLDVNLSGPALSGEGTNTVLWMADTPMTTGQLGLGILRYQLLPDGVCATNDVGTTAVAVGGSLTTNPEDVALDIRGNIYTIQSLAEPGDSQNRVFRFPAYHPGTNTGPITQADWAVGAGDDTMAGASGIAVDPTGTYVAVAFAGLSTSTNGCTQILYVTNGAVVTNLDLGVTINGVTDHEDRACAWDAVGNVYYIDNYAQGVWRAVSPPRPNRATTLALGTVQVVGVAPVTQPKITRITVSGGSVIIEFSAGTNDTASTFSVVGAATLAGPYLPVSGATVTSVAPGEFSATFAAGGADRYFRIARQGGPPPPAQPSFTRITNSGATLVLTFTGSQTDPASAFTLLSAAVVSGPYSPAPGVTITQVSPGTFQALAPKSGSVQFYRIKK
jgi:hypothetical protein